MTEKTKVAFICVHNSCRSQIAEALGKKFAGEKIDFYSAGTASRSDKPRCSKAYERNTRDRYGS